MNPAYVQTVNLLLDIAPTVFQAPRFAMKGGTALNLFVQDLPRLSVDIDVVFINHQVDRDNALKEIAQELQRIEAAMAAMGYETRTRKVHGGDEVKLDIFSAEAEVKVEVNFVFRGTVLPIQTLSLSEKTQALFSKNIQVPVLSPSELYGSKLVAAMDRQHPRDFFDVLKMYESHGLTQEILDCFVAYLAGHNRPVHEVLFSNP
jgi:predicted nucleotidyltransferase component of viral defense system